MQPVEHLVLHFFELLAVAFDGASKLIFVINPTIVLTLSLHEVTIHVVPIYTLSSLVRHFNFKVLLPVIFNGFHSILINDLLELLGLLLNLSYLGSISIKHIVVALIDVASKRGPLLIELLPACVFDPFLRHVHRVDHFKLLLLLLIDLSHKLGPSLEILDPLGRELLLLLELHDPRVKLLLLIEHLLLLINCLHHVCLCLGPNH